MQTNREKTSPAPASEAHLNDTLIDTVIHGDSIQLLRRLPDECIHLILSDIPYGIGTATWDVLHDNTNSALLGASPAQLRSGTVFERRGKPINGWSAADRLIPRQYYEWCASWAGEWFRVLHPGGSAIIFAGRRFSHRCAVALEDAGFSYKDTLAWLRPQAPHRAQRVSVVFERRGNDDAARRWEGWRVGNLRPIFEPILWFTKPYKIGTTIADNLLLHGVGAFNEAAFSQYVSRPDNILPIGFEAGEGRLHPTQKPVRLMEALIDLATAESQMVLDPFAGSGSTLVAARRLGRHFLGYELDPDYARTCVRRLAGSMEQLRLTAEAEGGLS
jgi:site-specific DNA-methyltransferase (adenine-specific)